MSEPPQQSPPSWMASPLLSEREQKSIDHARLYAALYDHGDPGHLHLTIIAKLAAMLDRHEGIEVHYSIDRKLEGFEP